MSVQDRTLRIRCHGCQLNSESVSLGNWTYPSPGQFAPMSTWHASASFGR